MTSHRHIDKVMVAKIDFGNTASPFHDNGVEALGETVKGSTDLLAEVDRPSPRPSSIMGRETIRMVLPIMGEMSVRTERVFSPEVVGITIADGDAIENHLAGMVALRFQEERIHVGVARDASRFCLNSLGTSYLQSFGSGI